MYKAIKISSAVATGAVIFSLMAPAAFAAGTVTVTGNGNNSNNTVNVTNTNTTQVSQSNQTVVVTSVSSNANTGGNSASNNTGGNSSVTSGDANSTVKVNVGGSMNTAAMMPCGCAADPVDVSVKNNGNKSNNTVNLIGGTVTVVGQANATSVQTGVSSNAKTGKNKADKNTGGNSTVTSGDSTSKVNVDVSVPSNTL